MTSATTAGDKDVPAHGDVARERDPQRGRRRRSTVGAGLLMLTVSAVGALGFMVGPASKEFGVTTAQYLIYYSLWTIGGAIAMAIGGALTRRIGVRRLILIGGTISITGLLTLSLAPSLSVIYVGGAIAGFGWGWLTTMAATIVVTLWHEQRRGSVLGLVVSCAGVGGALWGIVMPRVVEAGGWRAGYIAIAVAALVFIIGSGTLLIRNPPIQQAEVEKTAEPRPAVETKRPWFFFALIFGATFLMAFTQGIQQIFPNLLGTRGLTPIEAGAVISTMFIATILAKPLFGLIVDKWGIRAGLVLASLAAIVAFVGLTIASAQWLLSIFAALIAIVTTPVTIIVPIAITVAFGPKRFSSVYGLSMTVLYLGLAVAVPLWGLNFDLTRNYTVVLIIGAATTVVAMILIGFLLSRSKAINAAHSNTARDERQAAGTPSPALD
jgi:MFS family permease